MTSNQRDKKLQKATVKKSKSFLATIKKVLAKLFTSKKAKKA